MGKHNTGNVNQKGVMFLEALLAILIFSIGILAIIGMQAAAVRSVADSKYRADAAYLANQIIGDMWTNRTNLGSYGYSGGTASPLLATWVNRVKSTLPGVANIANNPSIVLGANNSVTVTIRCNFFQRQHPKGDPA
jgi:type IV pilus assembly protein PilV